MAEKSASRMYSQTIVEPIEERRHCTDIVCLSLFLFYLAGMILVAIIALRQGSLKRIKYMLDRSGNLCGSKNVLGNGTAGPDFTHQTFVYWLDPYDFIVDADIAMFKSVCVDKCPTEIGASICEYDQNWLTNYNIPLASTDSYSVGAFKVKGVAVGEGLANEFKDSPLGLDFTLITGRHSFLWYGNVMVVVSLFLILSTVILARGWSRWIEIAIRCLDVCSEAVDAIQPLQITQAVVYTQRTGPLQILSPISPFTKLKFEKPRTVSDLGCQIIYQGGKAIQTPDFMNQVVQPIKPSFITLFWERLQAPFLRPLISTTLPILCIILPCWVAILFLITSICTIQQQKNDAYDFVWSWKFYMMVIYHVLGLMWIWQSINHFNDMVIGGSISYYYWHRHTVLAPIKRVFLATLRYNIGSATFGGLFLVPALAFMKDICSYLHKLVQALLQMGTLIPKSMTCCIDQSLRFIKTVLSYLNRHAVILVAIKGRDYCASASLARDRLKFNDTLVETLNISPRNILTIGKILVSFTCAICAFAMSQLPIYSDISSVLYITSPIFLIVLTTTVAYAIAHPFLQVYKTTWDSLVLNLCEDCECHCNRPRYCPTSLMDTIQLAMELKKTMQQKEQDQPQVRESTKNSQQLTVDAA